MMPFVFVLLALTAIPPRAKPTPLPLVQPRRARGVQ